MIKSLTQAPINNQTAIVRVDYNVPINKEGQIADLTRITETLETIKFLQNKNCKILLLTHRGRPKGEFNEKYTLEPIRQKLSKILHQEIKIIDFSNKNLTTFKESSPQSIFLFENIRFFPEEEKCEPVFSKKLASLGDFFVNEAFGTAHRRHASTYGITEFLPSYAGLLMEKEIKNLTKITEKQEGLMMIFGGAKMETKIGVIKNFLEKAQTIVLGGGIANTFLKAQGLEIGTSLYEPEQIELAKEILSRAANQKNLEIILPDDLVIAPNIESNTQAKSVEQNKVPIDWKILDVGPKTAQKIAEKIKNAQTVVWNGPVGIYEIAEFAQGSISIARSIATHAKQSYLGGGDTIDVLNTAKISHDKFTFISTGGGAMLKFLEGKPMPVIKALMDENKQTQ
jgi:phosphoglycerate kinase